MWAGSSTLFLQFVTDWLLDPRSILTSQILDLFIYKVGAILLPSSKEILMTSEIMKVLCEQSHKVHTCMCASDCVHM